MSSGQITQKPAEPELRTTLAIADKLRDPKEIPADAIELVRQQCNLTPEQIADVVDAVQSGVKTPAEYLGVTPEIANTVEMMALEFYRQKHLLYAQGLYSFLIEMQPERATAWRGMGACLQVARGYPAAVLCYQRAIALDGNDVASMVFLGECLFIEGWREEAIRALRVAVIMGAAKPAQELWVKRAQTILSAQGGAVPDITKLTQTSTAPTREGTQSETTKPKPIPSGAKFDANAPVDIAALLAMDDLDFTEHPKIADLARRLQSRLLKNEITRKDIAGFTDEQLYGGYAAACRLIDAGKPLSALEVIGWMLYYDGRNGSYYQVAGLAAQHAKLYCFADYMYALSLIYDKDNPVTMLYQGEVKIYSFERHEGVEMLRRAVEMLKTNPTQALLVKRGKALIKQFEKKSPARQNAPK